MLRTTLALLLFFTTFGCLFAAEASLPNQAASNDTVLLDRADLNAILAELATIRQQNQAIQAELQLFRTPPVEQPQATFRSASFATQSDVIAAIDEPNVGYELCNDCCCPSWTARVGYVHFWRERLGSDVTLFEDTADNPLYNASDLDFDGAQGIDATLGWNDGCGHGFAVRYLSMDETFVDRDNFGGVAHRPATNPDTNFNSAGTFPDIFTYDFNLQSIEILRQRNCGQWRVSLGFRFIEFEETFVQDIQSGGIFINIFDAQNELYGLQIGVDGCLWDNNGGLQLTGLIKAGAYYNDIVATSIGAANTGSGQASDVDPAFVGELGLTMHYHLNCWTWQVGYQLLLLDGVALAADQVPNTGDLNSGPNNVPVNVDNNSLLLHGLNIGVERRW